MGDQRDMQKASPSLGQKEHQTPMSSSSTRDTTIEQLPLDMRAVLQLQREAGNLAVSHLLSSNKRRSPVAAARAQHLSLPPAQPKPPELTPEELKYIADTVQVERQAPAAEGESPVPPVAHIAAEAYGDLPALLPAVEEAYEGTAALAAAEVSDLLAPLLEGWEIISVGEETEEAEARGARKLGIWLGSTQGAPALVDRNTTEITAQQLENKVAGEGVDKARAYSGFTLPPDEWQENFRLGLEDVASTVNQLLTFAFISYYGRMLNDKVLSELPPLQMMNVLDATIGSLRERAVQEFSRKAYEKGYPA